MKISENDEKIYDYSLNREILNEFKDFIESLKIPSNAYRNMSDGAFAWRCIGIENKREFIRKFCNIEHRLHSIDYYIASIVFIHLWLETFNT